MLSPERGFRNLVIQWWRVMSYILALKNVISQYNKRKTKIPHCKKEAYGHI